MLYNVGADKFNFHHYLSEEILANYVHSYQMLNTTK